MTPPAPSPAREKQLIAAAQDGDEAAFTSLTAAYHGELHAHCYRMLGSTHDADDALQDAMLRAWRGIGRFQGRSSLRSWLYRIATNTSLDIVERRPKRVLPIDYAPAGDPNDGPGVPLTESVWIDPYPDGGIGVGEGSIGIEARYEQRESVELAFIAALQHLPARQRAALILREVLGFSAREVAATLETTVASVNSALQRARKTIEEKLPGQSQQQTIRELGDAGLRELVDTYMDAWERGDVEQVRLMLAEDAAITMPPMASWFSGREAVAVFLREFALARPWDHDRGEFAEGRRQVRLLPTSANGQPAYGAYRWHEDAGAYLPFNLMVLTLEPGGAIAEITGFVDPSVPPRFGLPERLEA